MCFDLVERRWSGESARDLFLIMGFRQSCPTYNSAEAPNSSEKRRRLRLRLRSARYDPDGAVVIYNELQGGDQRSRHLDPKGSSESAKSFDPRPCRFIAAGL
jgi:hypothetical protein